MGGKDVQDGEEGMDESELLVSQEGVGEDGAAHHSPGKSQVTCTGDERPVEDEGQHRESHEGDG